MFRSNLDGYARNRAGALALWLRDICTLPPALTRNVCEDTYIYLVQPVGLSGILRHLNTRTRHETP